MWNYTLDESAIHSMGKCKNFNQVNVISWNMDNFTVSKVPVEKLKNLFDLCKPVNQVLVFPQKRFWTSAQSLCEKHGGIIQTPRNNEENVELRGILQSYKDEYTDPVSGNTAWLGLKSTNYTW